MQAVHILSMILWSITLSLSFGRQAPRCRNTLSSSQAVVICSAWVRGERRGREERGMTVDGAERRGGMKQISYQPVS